MELILTIPDTILHHLLDPVKIPPMARVHHDLDPSPPTEDLAGTLRADLRAANACTDIRPGMRIAIGVGSRGIDRLPEIVSALVKELRGMGADPFIIPAMGSHGGATAEGQRAVLEHLGVVSHRVGAPILSQMDVVEIGRTDDGHPVYLDRLAHEADGIVFVARVKPHTAYHGPYESGLAKMISIGLGKQAGAAAAHALGFGEMARMVPAIAMVSLRKAPILFGVGVIENAHDEICDLRVVTREKIMQEEPTLLEKARTAMPRLPFANIDILVIDKIGKNISGDGADPNITGRFPTPFVEGGPNVDKQVLLDLTEATDGNANGVGTADFITARLVRKIDLGATYPNALTSTVPGPVSIPMILPSDRMALQAAIMTCHAVQREPRIVRIQNTLYLKEFWVSQALLKEVTVNNRLEVIEELTPLRFDRDGNLPL